METILGTIIALQFIILLVIVCYGKKITKTCDFAEKFEEEWVEVPEEGAKIVRPPLRLPKVDFTDKPVIKLVGLAIILWIATISLVVGFVLVFGILVSIVFKVKPILQFLKLKG